MTNLNGILGLSALIGVLCVPFAGCGGDDDDGAAGTGGSKAGTSGSGTDVAGSGGAAGGGSINDLINMFMTPMCEADATNVDTCGSESCPTPATDQLTGGCTVSCCTADNHCGTRNADTRFTQIVGSTCAVPSAADMRCPSLSFGGMSIPGCCDSTNHCGQLVGTTCFGGGLTGGFGGMSQQAVSCGGGDDAGVADAGL